MFEYSEEYLNALLKGIYEGRINPLNLPEDLYSATAKYLQAGVKEGFADINSQITFGGLDHSLIEELKRNICYFSAAKTFQQTLDMTRALYKDGDTLSFADFQKPARDIFSTYNTNYLRAEYDTAITQAGNAAKWRQVEQFKKALPYLRRVAVGDGRVCPICSKLDGITLPVDHPLWDQIAGAAHFYCRCIEEQLTKDEGEQLGYSDEKAEQAFKESEMPDEFKYNPGKQKEIFSTVGKSKHPYFTVPKKYRKLAEENFNLPLL